MAVASADSVLNNPQPTTNHQQILKQISQSPASVPPVDTSDHQSFADEIRACARNLGRDDVDALGRLYDLTAGRSLRYLFALVHDRDDAEDALQSAMVRIAVKPKKLAKADNPWGYFLRIVRNEALTIVRRKRPKRLPVAMLDVGTTDAPHCEDAELRELVQEAIDKLPAEQAEVVVLKIWEELTFAEIAEVLGESPNTAASRYRYALNKLTQHLRPVRNEVFYE